MAPSMDPETIDRIRAEGKLFMEDYYRKFDANRADLVNLFREESMLNIEDREIITGKEAIVAKLTSVQCPYHISNLVCATDISARGAAAQVTGFIWLDGKQEAVHFCQSFYLSPTPQGSFWISQHNWSTHDFRQKGDLLCNLFTV
ncbi:nuclear transport factor 2B-like [Syzygium oleosum]|uniref:nuclear transport factor 2B-like n=1 Tax=Syzygium oleosum TaxID=219896 RepID=UPI0024B9CBD4|nr:nuclear transport factor 2B-like [Syzygium oleosum]